MWYFCICIWARNSNICHLNPHVIVFNFRFVTFKSEIIKGSLKRSKSMFKTEKGWRQCLHLPVYLIHVGGTKLPPAGLLDPCQTEPNCTHCYGYLDLCNSFSAVSSKGYFVCICLFVFVGCVVLFVYAIVLECCFSVSGKVLSSFVTLSCHLLDNVRYDSLMKMIFISIIIHNND